MAASCQPLNRDRLITNFTGRLELTRMVACGGENTIVIGRARSERRGAQSSIGAGSCFIGVCVRVASAVWLVRGDRLEDLTGREFVSYTNPSRYAHAFFFGRKEGRKEGSGEERQQLIVSQ